MGMSIEDIIQSLTAMKSVIGVNQLTINEAIETMRKYKLVQAAHFRRLNIGMAAMLTDLKNELTDISWNIDMYDSDLDFECCYLSDIHEIIQEKINKLREELDGNDD